jgi:hypothetical protein
MKNIIIILALTTLVSCYTKQGAIKRFCSNDTTTLIIRDTIRTETVKHDTSFIYRGDTVTITKDKLVIRYFRVNDTTYISGECIGDTIYLEKVIKIPSNQPKPADNKYWIYLLLFFIGVIFTLFVTKK